MKKIFTILFFVLLGLNNTNAATFSSKASGSWGGGLTTWTLTAGTDADKIPDNDDDVIINAGHIITMSAAAQAAKTLLNNGTLTGNGKKLNIYGNFTNNSAVSGLVLYIQGVCVFTSTVPFSGATNWWIYKNLTISAGTSISTPNSVAVFSTVNNLGSFNVTGGLSMGSGSQWTNGAASSLSLSANSSTTGVLVASAAGNTVTYLGTAKQIKNATYYNLTLNGTTTKSVTANTVVLNDLTFGAGVSNYFDMNNKNLTVGGNWTNNSNNNIANQGTVTFNGSGTQILTRSSNLVIKNMVLAGTGTVLLGNSLNVLQSLTINSGTLDVSASNYTVNVAGNLTNNSTINARSGLFNFNGSLAQTVSGTSSNTFYNVTSSNAAGVSISSPATIFNILTVSSGAFGTSGAGTIKIKASGATTYGRIAAVGGSLTGTGWIIESWIDGPAPKGWQWLSSPINGNLLADWDNDPRFYMSGVGGNDGNAGSFKSVRKYSEVTGLYTNITTTNTALTPGKGFHLWMADNNTTGLTAKLIYNSVGIPNFGNVSFPITAGGAGGGYNLVGNPYACPITYSAVVAASGNLDASFIILQESGAYATDPNGGIIAPNQGFMCVATSGGVIQFTEACKNITTLPNILRTAPKSNAITFSVFNNINGLGGQTSVEFSESSADIFENNKDLSFLASPYDDADNVWTNSADNKSMLKNSLNNKDNEKNVPLTVKSGVYGLHTISVKGLSSLTEYNSVVLEDLNSGKKVDLLKEQNYTFDAQEVEKEYNFIVHFSRNNQTDVAVSKTIQENTLNNNTSVYNTPSNVVVKFDMTEETPVQISIYNLSGQQVIQPMNVNVTNDRIALPLQKENGLYLLIIKSKDQQITRKIIY